MNEETIAYIKKTIEHNLERIRYFGNTSNMIELTAQSNADSSINMLGEILRLEGYEIDGTPINWKTTKTVNIKKILEQQ